MNDSTISERDQIMLALEILLINATLLGDGISPKVFVTASRKFRAWKDVKPPEKPAVFLTKPLESHERSGAGLPDKNILQCYAYVYTAVSVKDGTVTPDEVMNPLIQAVEMALKPDDPISNRCTLGGLVYQCRVETELKNDVGDLDGEGVARIPIWVMIP